MPGTPKGIRYGGRKPNTPNKVTQSIRILLNTLLQPERLQKEWDYFLKHKDPQIRFAAFKLAQFYMFGRPSPLPLAQEDAPQQQTRSPGSSASTCLLSFSQTSFCIGPKRPTL